MALPEAVVADAIVIAEWEGIGELKLELVVAAAVEFVAGLLGQHLSCIQDCLKLGL